MMGCKAPRPAVTVEVVRRPADPEQRRRLVELLVELLDKPVRDREATVPRVQPPQRQVR
jgi:hypothetical protein